MVCFCFGLRFDHKNGFSWLEFERFVHSYVLPSAPWLYGVLKDGVFQHLDQDVNKEQSLSTKKKIDPYKISATLNAHDAPPPQNKQEQQHGERALKFRESSKGLLEISVISLASQAGNRNSGAEQGATNVTGGTAFAAHLRPLLNRTLQRVSKKTKAKSLDGAGIVSWNTKITFTDTGEGTEAARKNWAYGIDFELRVGETVCGGCFIDMYSLLDSGQFGVQVPVRSARKSDRVSWGGGFIGKIRISAAHIDRNRIEERESKRADQKRKDEKRRELEAMDDDLY